FCVLNLLCRLSFIFHRSVGHRVLHSFPTRRSSDLGDSLSGASRNFQCPASVRPAPAALAGLESGVRPRNRLPCGGGGYQGKTLLDRKSTRLNSSHVSISYAVFCLKQKNEY